MFKHWFSMVGVLGFVATAFLMTPDFSVARGRGGGGHGWGGRGWGGHSWSGYRGGWNGGHGYRGYGYHHRGYGWGWGWPGYYSFYRYYPRYYSTYVYYDAGYWPFYDYATTVYGYPVVIPPRYYPNPLADRRSNRAADETSENRTAEIDVRIPTEDTVLTSNDQVTTQTGTDRKFITSAMAKDGTYTARFNARWTQNGQEKNQSRTVRARARDQAIVDFTKPEKKEPLSEPKPERKPEPIP